MANRSPSPNLSRTHSGKSLKKLPWANPNSSKNSPSDTPQRVRAAIEQDENESDPKMNRARSPAAAAPPFKGAKNFMSPTISAASKAIAAASPKRKVLSERNDGTRSSSLTTDCSDSMESEVSNPMLETVDSGGGGGHHWESPKIIFSGASREMLRSRPLEDDFPIEEVPLCNNSPAMVSEEEDPSLLHLPPYDPKTNYLSPRPRFLHYRPKPRVDRAEELLVHGDGGLQLEERFSSESSSETSGRKIEEEIMSSSEVEESGEEVLNDGSSDYLEEDPPLARSSSRSRLVILSVVVLLITGLLGTAMQNPKISSSSGFFEMESIGEMHLRDPLAGFRDRGHLNLEKLSVKIKDWSVEFVASLRAVTRVLAFPHEDLGFFYSLEHHIEEAEKEQYLDQGVAIDAGVAEHSNSQTKIETETEEEEQKQHAEEGEYSVEEEEVAGEIKEEAEERDLVLPDTSSVDDPDLTSPRSEEEEEEEEEEETYLSSRMEDIVVGDVLTSPRSGEEEEEEEEPYLRSRVEDVVAGDAEEREPEAAIISGEVLSQIHQPTVGGAEEHDPLPGAAGLLLPSLQTLLGTSSVLLALAAIAIALRVKQNHDGGAPSAKKVTSAELASRSPETAMTTGESCPSESSSSFFHSDRRGRLPEDRSLRRDSTSSSQSFGSFTAYEKLSGKKQIELGRNKKESLDNGGE
ncbi:unnamed protein product [Spirodela intermedia]|uniref:Uncharacterized protein n=1 Tax=Spirodela intermedia TaxID=51605 RepID=A0A7I8KNQ2_SPIIN|nr:unnamed protein product [Spirodela intermedia]